MRLFVAVLLILSLLVPTAGALMGCSADPAASAAAAETETVTIEVDGMTCESCENAIQAAVGKLPGVTSCVASHTEKVARVQLAAGSETAPQMLVQTIRGLGYTAELR